MYMKPWLASLLAVPAALVTLASCEAAFVPVEAYRVISLAAVLRLGLSAAANLLFSTSTTRISNDLQRAPICCSTERIILKHDS